MQTAELALVGREASPVRQGRPWLFALLVVPFAVLSNGVAGGLLSFLLRSQGTGEARAASIVALLNLPQAIYFFWGPLTDFRVSRRAWVMLAAAASALAMLAAFQHPRLDQSLVVGLMFVSLCLGQLIVAACGGMMGTLRSEVDRRRAGGFFQGGWMAGGAIAVFVLVLLAGRMPPAILGWTIAAMVALPSLAALAAPAQTAVQAQSAAETVRRIWTEFKSTFLRWEAVPYTLILLFPMASGAMIGLLPGLAVDYAVSPAEVAWINGLAGALLMAAGAFLVTLIPVRITAPVAYLAAGLFNAASLAFFALGPLRPSMYFAGTLLFLFSMGGCNGLFTGVVLDFLGDSGKSGSARYAIINSLGNVPVVYMQYLDGRWYQFWGPRAMSGGDAVLSAVGATLLILHFVVSRRYRQNRLRSSA